MDVNAALDQAREALARIRAREARQDDIDPDLYDQMNDDDAETIIDRFEAIDGWLSGKGFLPSDWQR